METDAPPRPTAKPVQRLLWRAAPAAYRMERILRVSHSLNYRYAHSPRNLVTRLRLMPPPVHGRQELRAFDLEMAPLPYARPQSADAFGNIVVEARHETVIAHLTFIAEIVVANACEYDGEGRVLPTPIPGAASENRAAFLAPTRLTTPDPELERIAAEEGERFTESGAAADAPGLAWALCQRVFREMRYASGSTSVQTTASEAWATRQGVCQDFAHVLLTLCRLNRVPARYVSGFLPGEGAMHAWVEVLLPLRGGQAPQGGGTGDEHAWFALDPTHDRWVNERYVTVAVGRDYADISPTSGTYFGRGPGALTHRSRVVAEQPTKVPLD